MELATKMSLTEFPVLVVDDNPDIVKVIRMALEMEGYECKTA